MRKTILRRLGILVACGVVLFVVLQFIPVYGLSNPPVVKEPAWDSPQTRALAVRACFDCHSNETVWPWYASVAPVRWLLAHDVLEGRAAFNFSDWHDGDMTGDYAAEQIRSGRMPLPQYLLMHPDARLIDAEKQQLMDGLRATMK